MDAALGPTSYARMFPKLPSFQADEQFLLMLGRAGGVCDRGDIDDSPDSLADTAAGWPIFGQFVAHDITADRSILRSHANTAELHNARSPQLNLECLYGDGPTGHPFLYQRDDPAKFLLGLDRANVQRNAEGIAVIGDPRNDSHMLISQLHLAMLKSHNVFVDEARLAGAANDRVFDEAARELRWHYQWIVLNEFLPTLVAPMLAEQVLREGPRWFRPGQGGFIPLEFADAAYRYGHSQIRHRYQLNLQTDPVPLFPDLLGFRAVPRERTVDWTLFFDRPGVTSAQRAKKIDGKLVRALIGLLVAVTGECEIEDYHSLAVRDLQRGKVSDCLLVRPLPVTSESPRSPRSMSASLLPVGVARLLSGTTSFAKLTLVQGVVVLVPLAELLSQKYWLDSSMPTRHHFAGATRNGGLKKHLASYWSPDVVVLPSIARCRIDP